MLVHCNKYSHKNSWMRAITSDFNSPEKFSVKPDADVANQVKGMVL